MRGFLRKRALEEGLAPLLHGRKLIYCDVGARGGLSSRWRALRSVVEALLFDADAEEQARLGSDLLPGDRCLPYALWSEPRRLDLHLARGRGKSSAFRPNQALLALFPNAERYHVERVVSVEATTLDELRRRGEVADLDFAKMDVQGAELEILRGGQAFLAESAVGLEIEVLFVPLYEGQPLFPQVDEFVRGTLGFQLQDLSKVHWRLAAGHDLGSPKGQLVWGDALYLRPADQVVPWCKRLGERAERKIAMTLTVAVAYGYLDYACHVVEACRAERLCDEATYDAWMRFLRRYGRTLRGVLCKQGHRGLAQSATALFRLVQPSEMGFSVADGPLGNRRGWGWFR